MNLVQPIPAFRILLPIIMVATGARCAAPIDAGTASVSVTLKPMTMRVREQGNLQKSGAFSFWTRGVLGDWFLAPGPGQIDLTIEATGKTVGGVPARLGVQVVAADGGIREVGALDIPGNGFHAVHLVFSTPTRYFGLRLRHLNRQVDGASKALRHLLIRQVRVTGADRANVSLEVWQFFGAHAKSATQAAAPAELRSIETDHFLLKASPSRLQCALLHKQSGIRFDQIRPVLLLPGTRCDIASGRATYAVRRHRQTTFGHFTEVNMAVRPPNGIELRWTWLLGEDSDDALVRLDFRNGTGKTVAVHRATSVGAGQVIFGSPVGNWRVIGDAKSNGEPYRSTALSDALDFMAWWYLAAQDKHTERAVVLGNLTNNKGLGRFLLSTGPEDSRVRIAAFNAYENIQMPNGAEIVGEPCLIAFSKRGVPALEHFGDLIARAHNIDLRKQHPILPFDRDHVSLFTTWNAYGSSVVRGFAYRHDRSKCPKAYMDREWVRRNQKELFDLGLDRFGFAFHKPVRVKGAPTPLVRRYGQPDFWFKDATRIARAHPEFYRDGCIDFSNPAVINYERGRARKAFRDPEVIVRYGWDFTNRWHKLGHAFDPFQTSAETYRAGTGVWRDLARRHKAGAYAFVWMNIPGISYDRLDVIHIGHDSDQGYSGPGLTFTHGLTRQISGRFFYNGRVWWNSPDSFHVYVGGLYSHRQAKVHASFCAISGNLVHLGEPFTDEDIPEDRLEIIRRVAPTTADTAQAVDVFDHNPARVWNMRIVRPFGAWNVVGVFNVDLDHSGKSLTETVRFPDLGLNEERDYLVYEFWDKKFLGVMRDAITTTLEAPDCAVYSIVPKTDYPMLISTSRHVRQMALDITDLSWDASTSTLRGVSMVVEKDPYELRVFVPKAFIPKRAVVDEKTLPCRTEGQLATLSWLPEHAGQTQWAVRFAQKGK